jgi:hypothetical protein
MDFILIHTLRSTPTPQELAVMVEQTKMFLAKPGDFVPGGKLLISRVALNKGIFICIWNAPGIEALCPLVSQLEFGGWETDILPAETMEAHLDRSVKFLESMKK